MRLSILPLFLILIFSPESKSQCSTTNPGGCFCPVPGSTDCLLLPDITAGKKTLNDNTGYSEYGQNITGINKGLLRIDVSTPNVGWGPIEVFPTNDYLCGSDTIRNFFPPSSYLCPDGSFPKRLIKQRLYRKIGSSFQFETRDAGWMIYHPSHGHIHIDGWGQYTLRLRDASLADTLQWPIVNSGIKVSYCLIDLTTCSGSYGDCISAGGSIMGNADFPNYGLGGGYNCGNIKQGISVGKVDIYSRSLDESFVKIPYEACNGEYHVMVEIDPDNHFLEMNDNNNWLVAKVPLIRQKSPSNTAAYSYIFSPKGNVLCQGESLELQASGASSYLWNTGATTQKISVNTPGRYWVTATTPCGTASSDTLTITDGAANSLPDEIREDTVCTDGTATLYASGNAYWYDAPVNGNLIFVGNEFVTGNLLQTTTFYVANISSANSGSLGPVNTDFTGAGNFTSAKSDYLIFNAYLPFKLNKVKVNASSAGSRTFELRTQYGKRIASKTVNLTAGVQSVELDFYVPAGLNLQLGLSSTSSLSALYTSTTTSGNTGYPFRLSNTASIVGSSFGDGAYPFLYDWQLEVTPEACNTSNVRQPVVATVVAPVNVSLGNLDNVYYHTHDAVRIDASPAGGTLTGNGIVGNYFHPRLAGIGTHEITYSITTGNCVNEAKKLVTVDYDNAQMTDGFSVQVFNNPGPDQKLYVVSPLGLQLSARLLGSNGQLIRQIKYTTAPGSNLFDLHLGDLAKGIYMLELINSVSGSRKVFKLRN